MSAMGPTKDDLLWQLAERDEVEVETRRDPTAPLHRTTIWIVTTQDGIYVRSYTGEKGRWYREALANPAVRVHVGSRKAPARAEHERNLAAIKAVSAAYHEKYGDRWPEETKAMLKASVLPTTLRLTPK
jgi:hypothetical protein